MATMATRAKRDPEAAAFEKDLARQLGPFVAWLLDMDDGQRREALARLPEVAGPAVLRRIIDLLLRRLDGREGPASRRAAAALEDLGERAVPALCCELHAARQPALQARLVRVLGRIALTLPPARQMPVQVALEYTLATTQDQEVALAVLQAFEALRPGSAAVAVAWRLAVARSAPPGQAASGDGPAPTANLSAPGVPAREGGDGGVGAARPARPRRRRRNRPREDDTAARDLSWEL
jgi:hypothetical protein